MKTKKSNLSKWLLVLAINIPLSVQAQTSYGAPDCSEWVNEKGNFANKAWVMGYVSGLNAMHDAYLPLGPGRPNHLSKINSASQIFLWIDNYCKANPLKKVDLAGWHLFEELRKQ